MKRIPQCLCKFGAAAAVAGFALAGATALAAGQARFEPAASIRAAAEAAVQARLADVQGQVTATAEAVDPRLLVPACDLPLAGSVPAARTQDSARVTAEVRCDGSRTWRLFVPVNVTVRRAVVITAQPLERGKVLAPGDVILADREVGAIAGGYLTSVDAAVGRVLRRAVPAGAPLAPALLESPVLIRRGQAVTLEARTGALLVQAPGVARADGALGERIEVQNLSSKKVLQAVVKNEKYVEIRVP